MTKRSYFLKEFSSFILLLMILTWSGLLQAEGVYEENEKNRLNQNVGMINVDLYKDFKPIEYIGRKTLGYYFRSINPSYLAAYGLGQVLDQNAEAIKAHLKSTRDAIANTDNLTTDLNVVKGPLGFMTSDERRTFNTDLENLDYLLGLIEGGKLSSTELDDALKKVVGIENRVNLVFANNGRESFFLSKAEYKNYKPVVMQDGKVVPSKEPCTNVNKSYELSNGKSYSISTLKNSLKKKTASIASLQKKIEAGSLTFHGRVPPHSNYPVSKKRYEASIKKFEAKLQKIVDEGNDYVFSVSRAPVPGEWGYSRTKLEEKKHKAQNKLTQKLSESSLDYYSNQVTSSDVLIQRWLTKRKEVIAEYEQKIVEMKEMILLWEEVAQETLEQREDERQHILNLIAEHPCS